MKQRQRFLVQFYVCSALALIGPTLTAGELAQTDLTRDQVVELLGRQFYGVYIQGQKIGYVESELTESEATFVAEFAVHGAFSNLGRAGEFHSEHREVFDATAPYAIRAATQHDWKSNESVKTELVRLEDGSYVVETNAGDGELDRVPIDGLSYGLMDCLAVGLFAADPEIEVGSTISSGDLNLLSAEMTTVRSTVKEFTESVLDGVPTRLTRVSLVDSVHGDLGDAIYAPDGLLLWMELGGGLEIRLEPEVVAKTIDASVDLVTMGLVKVDRPLGVKALTRVDLRASGGGEHVLKDAAGQRVTRENDETLVRLGNFLGPEATEEEIARALRATPEFPIRDERVQSLYRLAIGDATSTVERVERLVRFVAGYLEYSYSHDAISVLTVIEQRTGDCTEHAHMFNTLARAGGIPTRVVGGLAYMGDEHQAFGGHAWNEVVLEGRWVAVDPTWNEFPISPLHVRLDQGEGEITGFETWGRLHFELVDMVEAESN